jgi:drug/metabolite transporter (DMT)-like permease
MNTHLSASLRTILAGIVFATLWASASAATKFGLRSVEPLVLANVRFILAGVGMLVYAYGVERNKLPNGQQWQQLLIFGFLNTGLYLGLFVLAMQSVAAGIGSLSTATNPLLISILSALWIRRRIRWNEWSGIACGMVGVVMATYPLLQNSFATVGGLMLLGGSMVSYSVGTIYYARQKWHLSRVAINGWQVLLGGLMLLPCTALLHHQENHFDSQFWWSVLWLIVPVSVIAVQLWLYLLKTDAVKASLWLFLCPIFGFTYATLLLDEPLTWHTVVGTLLVIVGLWLGQQPSASQQSKPPAGAKHHMKSR